MRAGEEIVTPLGVSWGVRNNSSRVRTSRRLDDAQHLAQEALPEHVGRHGIDVGSHPLDEIQERPAPAQSMKCRVHQ
jgi:hypothetical protein